MTKQELFDKMWAGFEAQGWKPAIGKSKLGTTQCRYLTKDGCKCAIGQLIPDGHPAQKETTLVGYLMYKYGDIASMVRWDKNVYFLVQAQMTHDEAALNGLPIKPAFEDFAERERVAIPQNR